MPARKRLNSTERMIMAEMFHYYVHTEGRPVHDAAYMAIRCARRDCAEKVNGMKCIYLSRSQLKRVFGKHESEI